MITRELLLDTPGSVFEVVPAPELGAVLERVEARVFPEGAVVVAEGENASAVYVARSGSADVLLSDEFGCPRKVGRVEPGTSFGEMSMLTSNPAVATVRATEPLEAPVGRRAAE